MDGRNYLKFLQENRENKITYQDLIAKKLELKEKYDEFWGYILVHDSNYWLLNKK